ncbi:hypothetical protein [Bradyrhizobium sp.]|uniref:hypothetical protein n=1 Tax=Bradyrhizobium sp. TaxID=376 RepID=UPI001EB8B700|nr:hypothetical protein [Bradyrhizobium sp.]MBV9985457.1 hypothetical protein [Bradyrhizobium sp.]
MHDILKSGSKIFLSRGLDNRISIEKFREISIFAQAIFDEGGSGAAAHAANLHGRANQSARTLPGPRGALSRLASFIEPSFRADAKHRTRNLEIPGSSLRDAPE